MMTRSFRCLVIVCLTMAPAFAEPGTRRVAVDTPITAFTAATTPVISPYIYLDRCVGGCTITGSTTNDAAAHVTTIPAPGTYTISEFSNMYGQTGTAGTCPDGMTACTTATQDTDCGAGLVCDTADTEWTALVECMQQVYSPYAVTLSDTIPAGGVSYTEAVIAGSPTDIGLSNDILGIAPLAANCSAQDNVMSFSFANHHPAQAHVLNICWTASQETAHAFGLDHEFQFTDGTSACDDPMTYSTLCGGEKFFRDKEADCGEYATRPCKCTATQNSTLKLLSVFGAGMSTTTPPTASIVLPVAGAQIAAGAVIHASAGAQRGVEKVELWLNGSKWAQVPGAAFGTSGQTNPSAYTITMPSGVPDSTLDIVIKAFDDLGAEGDSPTVTVTKGEPCTTAATCAKEQKCANGRCYWDPPTGALGASCSYAQFCESWECIDTGNGEVCTQDCATDEPSTCPSGFACETTTSGGAICVSTSSGGCCSIGPPNVWFHGGLAGLVFGFVMRRRRRCARG